MWVARIVLVKWIIILFRRFGMWLKYRKKPVVIEAVPSPGRDATKQDVEFFHGFLLDAGCNIRRKTPVGFPGWHFEDESFGLVIRTLEGDHYITPGDMIIRGVLGEFYPCKADIFEKTYEDA